MNAADVVAAALAARVTVGTAESLTAGQVSAALADVPGASGTLRGGIVAYANEVKRDVLGVDAALLDSAGSVDPGVAAQMAEGARRVLGVDAAVSTTGVAGPAPHDGQPVGTVFIAVATADGTEVRRFGFPGGRAAIRAASCAAALDLLGGAILREQM
ncbi:CinA family protein [Arthrobacter sp. TMN-37]